MMVRACGHSVVVNSRALAVTGITADTTVPAHGKIDRDASGQPSGMLRNLRQLVQEHIPKPDRARMKEAILTAQKEALTGGLTGIHTIETLEEYQAFAELEAEGLLEIRVFHLLPPEDVEKAVGMGIKPGAGSDRLWFGTVKLFADGSLGAGTALLHEPYLDCGEDECGLVYNDVDELVEKIGLAYRHGCDVAIHAIGDRAVTNALTAIGRARNGREADWRDRIEHIQLCRCEDFETFKKLKVVASVQPVFVPTDWRPALAKWGLERCRLAYAWKTIGDRQIRMQFGSDTPVEPIAPILGIQAAVTRQTRDGKPEGGWFPEQRLTLEDSLRGFTRNAAWTSRREDCLGTLDVSKRADLTVFSRDLTALPPREWPAVEVEWTVVNGRFAFQKG